MKAAALLVILLWQAAPANEPPVAQPATMRYERAIRVPAGRGQACAVLDAQVFPHSAPSLADLRMFPHGAAVAGHEVPFAITLSEAVTEETETARLLNLGTEGGKIAFDLEMPVRAYTDLTLNLDPAIHDFLATAEVSGSDALSGGRSTALGSFTLFDLSTQHLSRDTTLPLEESTFRYLHVVLSVAPAPGAEQGTAARLASGMVLGAEVPPSRESQILYSTVAEANSLATVGRESRATFQVPLRVPVERVEFVLAQGFKGNFSRDVRITALAEAERKPGDDQDDRPPLPETVDGAILRVHTTEAGREIRSEQLGVPAILGANLQSGAKVEVMIENGDDQPLPIAAVRLQMRQREVCFDAAAATGGLSLYYGGPKLVAPVYDYARLFEASDKPLAAELGSEQANPVYVAPVEETTFTGRHPEVLWIVLIAVICALGTVALRSAKNVGR
jgi:hypothetical protein